ncbi:RdgB/HAM1 family non-canonical purine NTP pyrophosphatase [Acidocella sp.]|uniref:RdgB/HAM1 family non-canonical purine NTP pyrophosphatase n=1 Tax=Acidocella sp. TaxID=50710 RepID=UPI002639DC37|nr:RdgB/HAM1 family non-canonical purine NTP pyrophosphatase [Acidocella sp.]
MSRIIIATHNAGKIKEFLPLLAPLGLTPVSAGELGLPEPEESAGDFAGNARLKAQAAARAAGLPALADDSGLSVAALGGAPGVHSARYAAGDYPAAFARILAAAQATSESRAWFTCALCFAAPDGATATYIGQAHGRVAPPQGDAGFGYDPIFIPDGYTQSYAELGAALKDKISHRARAFAQFAAAFRVTPFF